MSTLSADQIAWQLDRLEDHVRPLDKQLNALNDLIHSPDGPLVKAIDELMVYSAKVLADKINFDYEALTDWWLVCDFGHREPMKIGFNDEPLRSINNNAELAEFIVEYNSGVLGND